MLTEVAADLCDYGCQVLLPLDARTVGRTLQDTLKTSKTECDRDVVVAAINDAGELQGTLARLAESADAIIIIAPESGSTLLTCCNWLSEWREKFRSPDANFVTLTSDKQATCDFFEKNGVNVPDGELLLPAFESSETIEFPSVLKPLDGAGSENIVLVRDQTELNSLIKTMGSNSRCRIEEYVPGVPVSVSAICSEKSFRLLQPTQQTFKQLPFGEFTGAASIQDDALRSRARVLATAAFNALPSTRGYVGIDMVLAEAGADADVVIEVNPRLTSSYGLLRKLEETNLAAEMLACVAQLGEGVHDTPPRWHDN